MEMVFNEKSVSNEKLSVSKANELFSLFIKTYSKAVNSKYNISRTILTSVNINNLEISKGYYVFNWRNSTSVDIEERRVLLGLCQRQRETAPEFEDCQYVQLGDIDGKGLQISYECQVPLISIASDEKWKEHHLDCLLYDIETDEEKQVKIRNIFCEESLNEHKEWLCDESEKAVACISNSEELLQSLSNVFPSLVFHDNAIDQIRNTLNPVTIPTIAEKLYLLEKYFSEWDGNKFEREAFPRRFISPESKTTLSSFEIEHTFEWNGDNLLVSYHVRYTGGDIPGRIYVYPLHKEKKCLICSLYTKLPTVSDPKF